jgi:LCP family protein required for cell wall assembly
MSIYRDTLVSIDGQYDKINAAYSYGGPEQALNTINRNLDLNITDFATVNFKALADAVDILGGIELTIKSEKELDNLNDYIGNMNKINGGDSPKFDDVGTYKFDGNQAVAYSRIRYMEGGDHARAGHQRLVLEGILHEAKRQPWKINSLINKVLPQCKTSFSTGELSKMSMALVLYDIKDSQAYPFDSFDERYDGIYYGFPTTVKSNVIKAHKYLFDTKDYKPSDELLQISEKVEDRANEVSPY